jgi:hypothetical protein
MVCCKLNSHQVLAQAKNNLSCLMLVHVTISKIETIQLSINTMSFWMPYIDAIKSKQILKITF